MDALPFFDEDKDVRDKRKKRRASPRMAEPSQQTPQTPPSRASIVPRAEGIKDFREFGGGTLKT